MPTTPYTAWYDEVLPDFNGCTQAMALNAIKQAAIEFCERAWVWRVDQPEIPIVANQNAYDWTPPANTTVARALQVWLNKLPLHAKTPGELGEIYGDFMKAEGAPQFFVQDQPEKLIVVPKPTAVPAVGLTAKIAVKPLRAATGLESFIHEKYLDAITHGAKFRLYMVRKKPWTDTGAAADHKALFDAMVNRAKLDADKGYAGARARVRPSFF